MGRRRRSVQIRGLVLLALVRCAQGSGANLGQEMDREKHMHEKQLRAGHLTSYKAYSLARSPWEIGPLGDDVEPENEFIGFYRIIGSPLPPRHNESQLWDNLKYLVEKEPALERAKKIFVLNRLDPKLDKQVAKYLKEQGLETVSIPLDVENEYRPFQMEDTYGLARRMWRPTLADKFSRVNARLYVMNNNGARNYALRHGLRRGFAWTLPFDGNCMFDESTWKTFLEEMELAKNNGVAYVAIALMRTELQSNGSLKITGTPGEHQVAFTRRARIQFDPTQPYGHRPKVNLLWRLGVRGIWNFWFGDAPFRVDGLCKLTKYGECYRTLPLKNMKEAPRKTVSSAVVYRLPDGVAQDTATEQRTSMDRRGQLRDEGTRLKIQKIDNMLPSVLKKTGAGEYGVLQHKPSYLNLVSMESTRRECIATDLLFKPFQTRPAYRKAPEGALDQHPCSQIEDLVRLAESRLSTAETYEGDATLNKAEGVLYDEWRVGDLPDDVKLAELRVPTSSSEEPLTQAKLDDAQWRTLHANVRVEWDGHTKVGAYDRANRLRSYDLMTNITAQALAYFYTGRPEFAREAAKIGKFCFVTPASARSSSSTSKGGGVQHFGVLATKDLAFALDAVTLISATTFWTDADQQAAKAWCTDYLAWLDRTNYERRSARDLYFLAQYVAVALFTGKNEGFVLWKLRQQLSLVGDVRDDVAFFRHAFRSDAVHAHFSMNAANVLVWRALSNLGARAELDHLTVVLQRTTAYLDLLLNTTDPCFGREETPRKRITNGGCTPRAVAAEFAAFLCQWAFDADATFADHLSMCRRPPGPRVAPKPRFPILGTKVLESIVMPPLEPSYRHMGYPPFANLMW